MVEVKINFEKRHLFLIGAMFIFCLGVGLVFSMTAGVAPPVGHSLDYISGPASCSPFGGKLIWDNSVGSWSCDSSGETSYNLYCHTIETTFSNPVICCNDGEYAIGINDPELDSRAEFQTIASKSCVKFDAAASSNLKQVVCCSLGMSAVA